MRLLGMILQALMRGLTSAKAAKSLKGGLIVGTVVATASIASAVIDQRTPVMQQEEVAKVVKGCEALKLEPVYHLKADKVGVISVSCIEPTSTSPRTVVEYDVLNGVATLAEEYLSTATTQD